MGVLSKLLEVVVATKCCWTGVEKAPIGAPPGVKKNPTSLFCDLGVRLFAQSFLLFAEIFATSLTAPGEQR